MVSCFILRPSEPLQEEVAVGFIENTVKFRPLDVSVSHISVMHTVNSLILLTCVCRRQPPNGNYSQKQTNKQRHAVQFSMSNTLGTSEKCKNGSPQSDRSKTEVRDLNQSELLGGFSAVPLN